MQRSGNVVMVVREDQTLATCLVLTVWRNGAKKKVSSASCDVDACYGFRGVELTPCQASAGCERNGTKRNTVGQSRSIKNELNFNGVFMCLSLSFPTTFILVRSMLTR